MTDGEPSHNSQKLRSLRRERRDLVDDQQPEHHCADCESIAFGTEDLCLQCGAARPDDGWPDLDELNDPWLGRTVADRYLIAQKLGHGTSGDVYRAESMSIARQFAVKLITTDKNQSQAEQIIARLNREIEALSRLRNPHIVSFYEIFDLRGNYVAAVMDLIEGTTLETLVDDSDPLDVSRACALLRQTANGIYEAHQAGMIHRDLKPENLMVERLPAGDDFVHILDFGIVRLTDDTNVSLTQGFIGTPLYASPEQAMGKSVDHRSDIYSLGAILFFMLTGRPPFESKNVYDVLRMHVRETPPTLSEVSNYEFPGPLEHLTSRMLAKTPADRPDDLSRVIDNLDHFASTTGTGTGVTPTDTSPEPTRQSHNHQHNTPRSGILQVSKDELDAASSSDDDDFTDPQPNSSATIQAYRQEEPTKTPGFDRNHTPASSASEVEPLKGEISFHGTGDTSSAATAVSSATYRLQTPIADVDAAYASDGTFVVFERNSGEMKLFRPDVSAPSTIPVSSPDSVEAIELVASHLLMGHDHGTISELNFEGAGGENVLYQDVRRAPIADIAADPGKECIVAGSTSGRVYMRHLGKSSSSDWARVRSGEAVRAITINDSADTLAIARQDNTVELVGTANPRVATGEFRVDAPVRSMAISPDDYLLAAALVDRSVALYQLPTGRKMMSLTADHVDVLTVAFADDGTPVTVCSVDRQLRVLKFEQIGARSSST